MVLKKNKRFVWVVRCVGRCVQYQCCSHNVDQGIMLFDFSKPVSKSVRRVQPTTIPMERVVLKSVRLSLCPLRVNVFLQKKKM